MRCFIIFLLLVTFTACVGGSSKNEQATIENAESEAVRQTYNSYKEAILNQNGREALPLVTNTTIQYYDRMKEAVLKSPEAEVRQLSTANKMFVLLVRQRMTADSLQGMTPEEFFVHSINQGWVGKNGVLNSDIGKIEVSGQHASAEHLSGGKTTSIKYRFAKESGKWKLDLTAIMALADQAFKQVMRIQGMEEDELIFSLIESGSGRKVSKDIWKPLQK